MDSKENKEKKNEITPSQYFDFIKNAKNNITTEALKNSYSTFISLAEKYKKLGQIESMKKLCFLADVITKEEKLIEMGITTFVYRDVIEDYFSYLRVELDCSDVFSNKAILYLKNFFV